MMADALSSITQMLQGMNTDQYSSWANRQPTDPALLSRMYNGYTDTGTSGQLIDNQQNAQSRLAEILKFDPNATMNTIAGTSYSNESGQGTRPDQYEINYNQELDPANVNRKAITNPTVLSEMRNALSSGKYNEEPIAFDPNNAAFKNRSSSGGHQWVGDPSKVSFDEGTGQYFTPDTNFHTAYTGDGSFSEKWGNEIMPALVMSMAAGGMGAGLLGPLLGGGAFGSAIGSGIGKFGGSELLTGGNANPMQSIIGMLGSGASSSGGLQALLQMLQGTGG
jgi:hypothetical protein